MQGPAAAYLADGRLHLRHGPIDLIIDADGDRAAAFPAARTRFATILEELVSELPELRQPLTSERQVTGAVAQRMDTAARPFALIEPLSRMIAVAGAVADEVLAAMTAATPLRRAYVNNGGDIALHLAKGAQFEIAMADDHNSDLGRVSVCADDPVRGIATSGSRGRSLSRGIADAVTVVAADAATADAAATLIANAVDVPGHPGITRVPASDLNPDSDLGQRRVVTHVPPLSPQDRNTALTQGLHLAEALRGSGLIHSAALFLQGEARVTGPACRLTAQPEAVHA